MMCVAFRLVALLIVLGFFGARSGSAAPIPPPRPLVYVVALPIPIDRTNAANTGELRDALTNIRSAIPQASMVFIPFDHVASTPADWLAVLDTCRAQNFQAIVAFYDLSIGEGFRPTKSGETWNFAAMSEFVRTREVITHPALYALASLDEPWNPAKTPSFYSTALLQDMYRSLKALVPTGADFRLMMNFSRQIWKHGERDSAADPYYYAPGICDVGQISTLEFQRDGYDFATLDQNHEVSRRIFARETPGLPLFTTVQVFGSRYGPFAAGSTAGYWFPRERDGFHDLRTMLDDVLRPKYQQIYPLTGIAFQKWDANDTAARSAGFTLGEAFLPNSPPNQVAAANEALDAIRGYMAGARFHNISTRARVGSGEKVLIGGFIVTDAGGTGAAKNVILRGLGPSLTGIAGPLADPALELRGPNGFVATNDNWRANQSAVEATGIPPTNDREAALVATLAPGAYTVILQGAQGESGVGLVELYDLDRYATAQAANISTRGEVQTGENVMIGGIIVGGGESGRVLVRGIGPSLSGQGVANALQDPALDLVDSNGNILSNDDWRTTQEAEIIATTAPPGNDRESAIVATLAPGNYTAIIRGKDGATGVALVEAYKFP